MIQANNEDFIIFFNTAIAAARCQASIMEERIAKLEKSLKEKNEECERLKKDNEEMLREIINFRDRGLYPYGPVGF